MTEENSAEKSRPTSPEEKAEYYREFEAARRANLEAIRRILTSTSRKATIEPSSSALRTG